MSFLYVQVKIVLAPSSINMQPLLKLHNNLLEKRLRVQKDNMHKLVPRLQGPIQPEAAVAVITNILERNRMLFHIYNRCSVKTVKKLL